jgi:hypothetical protein
MAQEPDISLTWEGARELGESSKEEGEGKSGSSCQLFTLKGTSQTGTWERPPVTRRQWSVSKREP